MQKWADFTKKDVFSSPNIDLTVLKTCISASIYMQ